MINLQIEKVLTGHTAEVMCITSLPGSLSFATGFLDGKIIIWDSISFRSLYNLTNHKGGINSLAVSSNKYLLSASADTSIIKWNIINDLILKHNLIGHMRSVQEIAVLDDGSLASCSNDFSIKIWNISLGFVNTFNLTGHDDYVYAIVILPNNFIASGSKDLKFG